MARKRVIVGPTTTGLAAGLEKARKQGGGIQPGSHPELEKPAEIGNPVTQVRNLVGRYFKKKSPSHVGGE